MPTLLGQPICRQVRARGVAHTLQHAVLALWEREGSSHPLEHVLGQKARSHSRDEVKGSLEKGVIVV